MLQLKRLFFVVLVASLSLTAALAIGLLLFAEIDDTAGRILATTGLIALFSLLTLPAGALFDRRRHVWLAWLVVVLAAAAFAVAMTLVWGDWEGDEDSLWKTLATFVACAVASSQAAATTAILRAGDTRAVRVLYALSVLFVCALAAMVILAVWIEVDDETFYRILGATAVADVLVVILQPILRRPGGGAAPGGAARLRARRRAEFRRRGGRARRAREERRPRGAGRARALSGGGRGIRGRF